MECVAVALYGCPVEFGSATPKCPWPPVREASAGQNRKLVKFTTHISEEQRWKSKYDYPRHSFPGKGGRSAKELIFDVSYCARREDSRDNKVDKIFYFWHQLLLRTRCKAE